jgi:hypothetical protein
LPFADGSKMCVAFDVQCVTSCAGQADGTPCSDGTRCTDGTCQAGVCAATPALCGDGDPCTGADYCHPLLGCRTGSPPVGDPLCEAPPPDLDAFACYRAATSRGEPRFEALREVGVADAWGAGSGDLRKPVSLCLPIDLAGTAPGAPAHPDKLEGYQLRMRSGTLSGSRLGVPVTNALGTLQLNVKRVDSALVQTTVGLASPPVAPVPPGPGSFSCYKVGIAPGTPKFVPVPALTIRDVLGELKVDLRRPTRLCTPLDLAGSDPEAPARDERLLCYQVKPSPSAPRFARRNGLFASNALGEERLDALKLAEVCLPSR